MHGRIGWCFVIVAAGLMLNLAGCAVIHNQYAADSPSYLEDLDTPSTVAVRQRYEPAPARERDWPAKTCAIEPVYVVHGPLYFEDPFEDKGTTHQNRLGCEDWIALPYCYSRYTLNWLLLPASMIVTPPWTAMESDGYLSRQLVWCDHDATPVAKRNRCEKTWGSCTCRGGKK